MDRLIVSLIKNMTWLDSSRLFGMLNAIYSFQEFLEDTRSLAPQEAKQNREACASLFEKAYSALLELDFKALARQLLPRPISFDLFSGNLIFYAASATS